MGKTTENIIKFFKIIFGSLLEIIYPSEDYCILCKTPNCNRICISCLNKIKNNTVRINLPLGNEFGGINILSYGHYGGPLKQLILKLKYNKNFTAGDILSELLEEYIRDNIEYNNYIISYIPLSKKSKKSRGFNQCEYIARKIADNLSIRCENTIIKVKETREQKTLKRFDRLNNIKDAFEVNPKINLKNTDIILIDDVTTTGATLIEAYSILKKSQVNQIKLLTLAKSHI